VPSAGSCVSAGTNVDDELLFIRVLADLGPPHIRCLRIMATELVPAALPVWWPRPVRR
jgi:hypothetical protein